MKTHLQTIRFSAQDLVSHDVFRFHFLRRWPHLLALLRSQATLAVLAVLTTSCLMLAFHQVVLGAVAQGEFRQQARNLQSQAFWRCARYSVAVESDNCQRQVNGTVSAEAGL